MCLRGGQRRAFRRRFAGNGGWAVVVRKTTMTGPGLARLRMEPFVEHRWNLKIGSFADNHRV